MPQYNAPSLVTSILSADTILFWKSSLGAVRTITFSDFVQSVADLIPHKDKVSIVSSNTALDGTYQFIVANSGSPFTMTLPPAVNYPGRKFRIANKGSGALTVIVTGSDAISAGALGPSTTVTQYNTYDFESDGVDTWYRTS